MITGEREQLVELARELLERLGWAIAALESDGRADKDDHEFLDRARVRFAALEAP